jgi:hypothetical protein
MVEYRRQSVRVGPSSSHTSRPVDWFATGPSIQPCPPLQVLFVGPTQFDLNADFFIIAYQ